MAGSKVLKKIIKNRSILSSSQLRPDQKKKDISKFKISKSKRANLTFPVSRVDRMLRDGRFGFKKLYVNTTIFLTAVLEYLVSELLMVSLDFCHSLKKTRIIPRQINWGVDGDVELSKWFKDVHIAGAGIVPQVIDYPKSKRNKSSSSSNTQQKSIRSKSKKIKNE